MEPKVALANNGQAVALEDFNAIGEQAAMSAEYIWAQLLRTSPVSGGSPMRGIIPAGGLLSSATYGGKRSLIGVSGSANSSLVIQPFVAVIGSTANELTTPTGPHDDGVEPGTRDALREIRLAYHWGTPGNQFQTTLQLPPVSASGKARWDAIYAKVDVDTPDPSEPRYQKIGAGPINPLSVSVVTRTKVAIGRVGGAETTIPTQPSKPAIPADGGGSYYILLGYRMVQHTDLTTSLTASWIQEAFDPLLLSPANGGIRAMPANGAFHPSGYAMNVEAPAHSAYVQPVSYLGPNMAGMEMRIVTIHAQDTTGYPSANPNAVTVLDDTVDWRKRYFLTFLECAPASGGGDGFPHKDPTNGNIFAALYSPSTRMKAGQSFKENMSAESSTVATGCSVVFLDNTSDPNLASGAKLAIFVDQATGKLCCWRNNVNADRRILALVFATGRHQNNDTTGL